MTMSLKESEDLLKSIEDEEIKISLDQCRDLARTRAVFTVREADKRNRESVVNNSSLVYCFNEHDLKEAEKNCERVFMETMIKNGHVLLPELN